MLGYFHYCCATPGHLFRLLEREGCRLQVTGYLFPAEPALQSPMRLYSLLRACQLSLVTTTVSVDCPEFFSSCALTFGPSPTTPGNPSEYQPLPSQITRSLSPGLRYVVTL